MIKAILFDLDNTLIDRQKAFKEMLFRVFSNIYDNHETVNKLVNETLLLDDNGKVPRIESFTKLKEKFELKDFDVIQADENWKKESGTVTYLFDDVIDTLKTLKSKYKIAVVTNGAYASQKRKLDSINLYELLDYCLISDEIGIRKPDPRIFQYACKQMGFKEEECIYVGDSYDRDVLGALNAGLDAIYVSRTNQKHNEVKTIYQINDLLKIL